MMWRFNFPSDLILYGFILAIFEFAVTKNPTYIRRSDCSEKQCD